MNTSRSAIRVAHITSIGETARRFLLPHFRSMKAAGYDVMLICPDDEHARFVVAESGVRHVPVPLTSTLAPVKDLLSVVRLWRVLRRQRPDVVHAHMTKIGLLGTVAARLANVPVVIYHNHGMAFTSRCGLGRLLFRLLDRVACGLASRVLFCGPSTRRAALAWGVCSPRKAAVLGPGTICGVDLDRFAPDRYAEQARTLRSELGLPPARWLVGFVGRIVPHKGLRTLLAAWRELPKELREQAELVLVGPGGNDELVRWVQEQSADRSRRVRYLGYQSDTTPFYAAMDLLVLPSWHEGFPYSVLEAAAMGTTAIATAVTGNVDAVVHGQTGLLTPCRNAGEMARAIARLLTDADLRQRLGQNARRRVEQHFCQTDICNLLLKEYDRLRKQTPRFRQPGTSR